MMWDFILRPFMAGILGAVVRLDREYRAKEVGYRIHFLVSLGSTLTMVVSQYDFQDVILENSAGPDPNRVATQVMSGIGFIGAGMTIIRKQFVRGLTIAAGIWAIAGIGLTVGPGIYGLGIAATLLTLTESGLLSVIFKSIGIRSSLVISSIPDKEAINRVARVTYEEGFLLAGYDMRRLGHQEKNEYVVSIVLKARENTEESSLLLLTE